MPRQELGMAANIPAIEGAADSPCAYALSRKSRKPFRAFGSDEGSNPSASARSKKPKRRWGGRSRRGKDVAAPPEARETPAGERSGAHCGMSP